MQFKVTEGGSGGSYEKPAPGRYLGVLVGFADLGTQETKFGEKRQVMLRWELHKRKGPSVDSQGHPHTITARYTASLDAKSSLRPVVESHVGRLTNGKNVVSQDWLGHAVQLVLEESIDGKYVNVTSVSRLDPEEDLAPKQILGVEHWEITDKPPPPVWCAWIVQKSKEFQDRPFGEVAGHNAKHLIPAVGDADDPDEVSF